METTYKPATDDYCDAGIRPVFTLSTCGEACWQAQEDICRCSCGGRNHGCDRNGEPRPDRTCRVNGYIYRVIAIVPDDEPRAWQTAAQAADTAIKASPWPESPNMLATYDGSPPTRHYSWRAGDRGIPAFDRRASESAMKWPELEPYRAMPRRPYLIWQRIDA